MIWLVVLLCVVCCLYIINFCTSLSFFCLSYYFCDISAKFWWPFVCGGCRNNSRDLAFLRLACEKVSGRRASWTFKSTPFGFSVFGSMQVYVVGKNIAFKPFVGSGRKSRTQIESAIRNSIRNEGKRREGNLEVLSLCRLLQYLHHVTDNISVKAQFDTGRIRYSN